MRHVTPPVVGLDKKMEDRTIVPDVHRLERPSTRDVSLDPRDGLRGVTKPGASTDKRFMRHVENGQAIEPAGEQLVHQSRLPTPNVHDAGASR